MLCQVEGSGFFRKTVSTWCCGVKEDVGLHVQESFNLLFIPSSKGQASEPSFLQVCSEVRNLGSCIAEMFGHR